MGVYLATKLYSSCTWELWLSFLFLYSKIGFIMLFLTANTKFAFYYALVCFVSWLTLSHP